MAINIYDTHTMLAAVEVIPPKRTFLRDRYFSDTDIFPTKDVVVDYKDELGNKLAPFVLPTKGGIPVGREGFETETYTPALVAPQRTLTADDLMNRQAGEALFSGATAESREAKLLRDDIEALNRLIDNREEYLCAQTLLANAYTMKQYGDKYATQYVEKQIKFYEGGSNPATYTPGANWSTNSTKILSDIYAMAEINIKRGLPMTDLIVAGDVADVMLANEQVLKLLDNRRFILTDELRPEEQAPGAAKIATLNIKGHIINVFSYTAEYYDDEAGETKSFIPSGKVVMTAPDMGRIAYGAVTQIQFGSSDFETIPAKRVPKVSVDQNANIRTLTMSSRPLVMPKVKNAAIVATVLS